MVNDVKQVDLEWIGAPSSVQASVDQPVKDNSSLRSSTEVVRHGELQQQHQHDLLAISATG